jgi:hypothetical protein
VRRVWQNAPTANESRSDGLLQKKPWTSCRGPTSKISNNCVFGNGYLGKDISEGQGGYEQFAFQGVEVANYIVRGEPRARHSSQIRRSPEDLQGEYPPQLSAQRHPEGLQACWSGVLGEW